MALFKYSVTIVILCLTMDVHSEMSGDLVFALLSDQIKNVAIKMYIIEKEQDSINQRLDSLESQLLLPSNTDIAEGTAKDDIQIPKKKEDRLLKALAAEKTLVRNMLNSYEGELITFQNTVGNQIKWMNQTLKTNNENMETKHEENTLALNNKITLLKQDLEMSTVILERKLKATNALIEVESVERQPTPTVSGTTTSTTTATTTTSIDTDRGTIKVGDRVRVKSSVDDPSHGWGHVTHDSIGTVSVIWPDAGHIMVNFPEHSGWSGVIDEMEPV